MSAKKPKAAELMEVIFHMNLAHDAAMVALVKTLEQAGLISARNYEHVLRLASAAMASKGQPGAAALIDDLADMMRRDEVTRQ